jgi:hypothetical protein
MGKETEPEAPKVAAKEKKPVDYKKKMEERLKKRKTVKRARK